MVKTWQNVEKFKGGEYFCKALYVMVMLYENLNIKNVMEEED